MKLKGIAIDIEPGPVCSRKRPFIISIGIVLMIVIAIAVAVMRG